MEEAFLDVSGLEGILGSPSQIAVKLRAEALAEVGLAVTVGVARTKTLAKMASRAAKPDGLLVVAPERERDFIDPLPVESLWGVGPSTARSLHDLGVRTVHEIAAMPVSALATAVGRHAAEHLHDVALCRDARRVRSGRSRRSIGSQTAFPGGSKTPPDVILAEVVDRVTRRMRKARRIGRTVILRLRFARLQAGDALADAAPLDLRARNDPPGRADAARRGRAGDSRARADPPRHRRHESRARRHGRAARAMGTASRRAPRRSGRRAARALRQRRDHARPSPGTRGAIALVRRSGAEPSRAAVEAPCFSSRGSRASPRSPGRRRRCRSTTTVYTRPPSSSERADRVLVLAAVGDLRDATERIGTARRHPQPDGAVELTRRPVVGLDRDHRQRVAGEPGERVVVVLDLRGGARAEATRCRLAPGSRDR